MLRVVAPVVRFGVLPSRCDRYQDYLDAESYLPVLQDTLDRVLDPQLSVTAQRSLFTKWFFAADFMQAMVRKTSVAAL